MRRLVGEGGSLLTSSAVSSVVEHYLDTVGVRGSNPLSRTTYLTMSSISSNLNRAIDELVRTLKSLKDLEPQISKAADLIAECFSTGNKLLMCGNGGSAADASHFATELVVRFAKDRRALPAICLTSDSGILTAAGNDYGFDEVFARQVAAFGVPGDVLICLTTSGTSRNVIRALEEAKACKLRTIAFLGRDGGSTIGIADIDLLVKR